ncbi:MAG TPA: hypothetical protein VHV82_22075 [Sporichthyaceae bacterium]|jgi:hypothetical protein|nr:hypothetical protein [Sporichthyaceae bacterium]
MSKRAASQPTITMLITVGMALAAVGVAPDARAVQSSPDDLHPNLVRADAFTVAGSGDRIDQDVSTQPGAEYRLSFDYAEHPLGAPGAASFDITFGATTLSVPVPIGAPAHRQFVALVAPAISGLTRLTVAAVDPGLGARTFPEHIAVHRLG